jgi:hypothetical protein
LVFAPDIGLYDGSNAAYASDLSAPVDFGTVLRGQISSAITLKIVNFSTDVKLVAVEVDGLEHPYGYQSGDAEDTYDVMEFSATSNGTYTDGVPLYIRECPADSTVIIYAKWSPPTGAAVGTYYWGIVVTGNYEGV